MTGRRVSSSQEDEESSKDARRCTDGKPHTVVLSVTQLPLSCVWGGNTLSNLSEVFYCRGLPITPQAAKLSIGIASSEAPDNFSGAYRSGGFRLHHNGHHAVLPAKIIYVLGIAFSVHKNKSLSQQVMFRSPFASEECAGQLGGRRSAPGAPRTKVAIDLVACVGALGCPDVPCYVGLNRSSNFD